MPDQKEKEIATINNEKHLDLITDRVTPLLRNCLIENIRTMETSNVTTRIRLITEQAFEKLEFKDPLLKAGLKALFLKKSKELLEKSTIKASSDENNNKIESIALSILPEILDGSLFEEDDEWLDQYIDGQLLMFVHNLLKHYFNMYFQKVEFAMLKNWDDAELLTFGKEQSRFTMAELDNIIKSGQGFNAWLGKKRKGKIILRELAEEYCQLLHNKIDKEFVDEVVDKTNACSWNADFRTFCLKKYDEK